MLRLHYSLFAIAIALILNVDGSCLNGPLQTESKAGGSVREYCQYNGKTYDVGAEWIRGYPDCLQCSCTKNGLSCCGFGIGAGIIAPPAGYKLKPGTCVEEFIKDEHSHTEEETAEEEEEEAAEEKEEEEEKK